MRKNLFPALALASALTFSGIALAAPPGQDSGCDHEGRPHAMRAFEKLNLSDSQKASIKQIMQNSFAEGKGRREALIQQRQAFAAMQPTDPGYQAAADSLAQAEGAAATARVQQMAGVRAQVHAVLTPAQQTQLASMKAERQTRRQQWQEGKGRPPRGMGPRDGQ
ncbi:MAG: Spy/CpxP family protein refolding chaperone [Gammaproteobacteria bacterium]|nr:Spy/CpxP family protein refolding chaperone [Gammaproteobacteria bacterium]